MVRSNDVDASRFTRYFTNTLRPLAQVPAARARRLKPEPCAVASFLGRSTLAFLDDEPFNGATTSSETPLSSAWRASGRLYAVACPRMSVRRLKLDALTTFPGFFSVNPISPSTPEGESCWGSTSLTTDTCTPGM